MDELGIGVSNGAAQAWLAYDPTSYQALYLDQDQDYTYFVQLPDWAYDPTVGPFFVDDAGAIYSISLRPSQSGLLIGNLKD